MSENKEASLLSCVFDILKELKVIHKYSSVMLLDALLGAVPTICLSLAAKDQPIYFTMYVLVRLFTSFYNYFYNTYTTSVVVDADNKFRETAYKKYEKLTPVSKKKMSIDSFQRNLESGVGTVRMVLDWGLGTVIDLSSTIFGCAFVIIQNGMFTIGLGIITVITVVYLKVIRELRKKYVKMDKEKKKENEVLKGKIPLYLQMMRNGGKTWENLMELELALSENFRMTSEGWVILNILVQVTGAICLLPILFINSSVGTTFVVLMEIQSVNKSFDRLMNFMNKYDRLKLDYSSYVDMWKDMKFSNDDIPQIDSSELAIENVDLKLGGITYSLDAPFTISSGMKFVIRGETGSGKSTFLDMLTGNVKGLTLREGEPLNYLKQMTIVDQSAQNCFPKTKVPIRALFFDETDNWKIWGLCELVHLDKWLKRKVEKSEKKSNKETTNILSYDVKDTEIIDSCPVPRFGNCIFDEPLEYGISGGEHSRLVLAASLTKAGKIILLDEVDIGVDPDTVYSMYNNIMKKFSDRTIGVITHSENYLQHVQNDLVIYLNNGRIQVQEPTNSTSK